MSPFWWCQVVRKNDNNEPLPLQWRCWELQNYRTVNRVNPQLGWVEWCDTRQQPENWLANDFDDASWAQPSDVVVPGGEPQRARLDGVKQFEYSLQPIDSGILVETFGYETDDPAARFFLRDLLSHDFCSSRKPTNAHPQGVWRRYDLGRVRLGRPSFELDLPEGAVVEFAMSEALMRDRVAPYITISRFRQALLATCGTLWRVEACNVSSH